jgi:hypothetical protein
VFAGSRRWLYKPFCGLPTYSAGRVGSQQIEAVEGGGEGFAGGRQRGAEGAGRYADSGRRGGVREGQASILWKPSSC